MADTQATSRSRSASPAPKAKKQKTGGFKWKDSKKADEDTAKERSYRERSPKRARSPSRVEADDTTAAPTAIGPTTTTPSTTVPSVADKFGASYKPRAAPPLTSFTAAAAAAPKPAKERKKKPSSTPKPPSGPMIIVNVNDRLGTKAAIPCLASDSVRAFKAIVAAHIGRQPHEIMLKRQGERPFKDALTLEDYGVSSGVQLDLEVDTGD